MIKSNSFKKLLILVLRFLDRRQTLLNFTIAVTSLEGHSNAYGQTTIRVKHRELESTFLCTLFGTSVDTLLLRLLTLFSLRRLSCHSCTDNSCDGSNERA